MGENLSGGRISDSASAVRDRLSPTSGADIVGLFVALLMVLLVLDIVRQLVTGEITFTSILEYLWWGLRDAMYIALAAVGLSMTYSILRFANFSHGDLITTGAFGGWAAAYLVGGWGIASVGELVLVRATSGGVSPGEVGLQVFASPVAILIGMVVAGAVTVLVALAIDQLVYKRMRDQGGISMLIASVGVALALRYSLAVIFTNRKRGVTASAPDVGPFTAHELTLVLIAFALIVGLHLLLQRTKLGKSMRAMADNKDLALITGIPTERVITATWIIGAAFAGISGYLIVLDRGSVSINLGWFLLLLIFAAVILGGIGSIYGALVGSLVIGMTVNVSLIWLPSDLANVSAFILMILILVFKPNGLLGGVETA
ncbi:branched-chain amino acid ABC-type transport system, permease component [Halovivax ruber XH-70]|uniref:Branched-chain amino acid ABC-type transport system, permease component n=1 Tax=Halovivax ruber (strain DSM 18193 / JCM 13892 / XH-70) TaxID=797302 RepID=L0IA46_HALRX|nr:branched-chain amino acid ABC transporter permease [Halovivax ruber]AGB16465.1 branched-chain amino acid ABC-type transport system, permease component [Halovivax ruber XH-70]